MRLGAQQTAAAAAIKSDQNAIWLFFAEAQRLKNEREQTRSAAALLTSSISESSVTGNIS